ncbi:MAG: site-specific integrase [Proteobacteria bacterium]|nr:site-specific integrase [Pseudomonadota bacterium]
MADPKDLLQTALAGARSGRDYTLELPNGVKITTDGSEADYIRAKELAVELAAMSAPAAPASLPIGLVSARVQTFISQMKAKDRSATNLLDTTFTLNLFVALIGDKELSAVNTDDLDTFLDALAVWPSNASKKKAYEGLTPREIVAKAKASPDKRLASRTKEKHLDRLRTFFGYCVGRRLLDHNPCTNLGFTNKDQDEAQTRKPFSDADLRQIFDPKNRTDGITQPHKFWAPVFGLYTGARVNEIAQLYVADVEEIDGVWGIHINKRWQGQRLKNASSRRFLPLHPAIIKLGFLDYLADVKEAHFDHLWPGLTWGTNGPGDSIGDWFNRSYLRGTCGIKDPAKTFHSFRHTFASLAERSGVTDQRNARLTGHSSGTSVLRRHYIDPPTLSERVADLAAIKFPFLELNRRPKGFFKPWFKRVKAVESRKSRDQPSPKLGQS